MFFNGQNLINYSDAWGLKLYLEYLYTFSSIMVYMNVKTKKHTLPIDLKMELDTNSISDKEARNV